MPLLAKRLASLVSVAAQPSTARFRLAAGAKIIPEQSEKSFFPSNDVRPHNSMVNFFALAGQEKATFRRPWLCTIANGRGRKK
jgi:hypothetical protein